MMNKMLYPRIPKHELWRSVKYTDKQIALMKKWFSEGVNCFQIKKRIGCNYLTVLRYCKPEIIKKYEKDRWEKSKNDPVYLTEMKIRRRKNEHINVQLWPEKRKYNNEFMKEWHKTPEWRICNQRYEKSEKGKATRKRYNETYSKRVKSDPEKYKKRNKEYWQRHKERIKNPEYLAKVRVWQKKYRMNRKLKNNQL